MIRVAYNTIFFPALTVLLLKGVGFIDSIFLKTQRERIFLMWLPISFISGCISFSETSPDVPLILTGFIFGVFLSSSVALLANIYFKISMHALGVGALSGLMLFDNFYRFFVWNIFTCDDCFFNNRVCRHFQDDCK